MDDVLSSDSKVGRAKRDVLFEPSLDLTVGSEKGVVLFEPSLDLLVMSEKSVVLFEPSLDPIVRSEKGVVLFEPSLDLISLLGMDLWRRLGCIVSSSLKHPSNSISNNPAPASKAADSYPVSEPCSFEDL